MSPQTTHLLVEAMALPIKERAALAYQLLKSLDAPADGEDGESLEDAWTEK